MKFTAIKFTGADGTPFALSNIFSNVYEVYNAIEDAVDGEHLLRLVRLAKNTAADFSLDRNTEMVTRIKIVDLYDNVSYLCIYR